MRRLVGMLIFTFLSGASLSEPLGRLFFSPAERTELDAARHSGVMAATTGPAQHAPSQASILTYSGFVRRGDGRTAFWINNELMEEGRPGTTTDLRVRISRDGTATIRASGVSTEVNLKAGQSVSGTVVMDAYLTPTPSAPPRDEALSARENPAFAMRRGNSGRDRGREDEK